MSYLNNPLLPTPFGKYSSKKLDIDQLDYTNRAEAETTLLPIITEFLGPKVFAVGVSQAFRRSGERLGNTKNYLPIINSKQITTIVDRQGPLVVWIVVLECVEEDYGRVVIPASGLTHQEPSDTNFHRLTGREDSTYPSVGSRISPTGSRFHDMIQK